MSPARLLGLLAILVVAGLVGCHGGDEQVAEPVEIAEADELLVETEEPADEVDDEVAPDDGPLKPVGVRIYFPAAGGNGLVGEVREIFKTAQPGDRIKQIVADLIEGPDGDRAVRALPSGLRLRQAYVLADGTAYLDFSAELLDGVGGGSMRELLTVYAIVDSVALNVPEVRRVGILVNGRPIETLNGHLDLRRPLKPDRKLILGSRSALARGPATFRG